MNKSTEQASGGCGFGIALLMLYWLITTVCVAIAWNVGLYGASIVDNKIGFWTAFGLALGVGILRSIIAAARTPKQAA